MVSVSQAQTIIREFTSLGASTTLSLADAIGLVAVNDIIASYDIPAYPQSSMDGYALRFEDRMNSLAVVGEMTAGSRTLIRINKNEATRIFTGAPLPDGADTVVMQEKSKISENMLLVDDSALLKGAHMRATGAEIKQGEMALLSGSKITVAAAAFLAGIGVNEVMVYKRPSVAIILTGNELIPPGKPLELGQVYDANSVALKAALMHAGVRDVTVLSAKDDKDELENTLREAMKMSDVVLLTGGVSVGDYDFVTTATERCGVQARFHKVMQRPGKPLYFGTKNAQLIFGLPGNPSSALTCFYMYVLPALGQMMHLDLNCKTAEAILQNNFSKVRGLTQFVKAHYADGAVTILHAQESFRLHSFARSNALAELEEGKENFLVGDLIKVHQLPS